MSYGIVARLFSSAVIQILQLLEVSGVRPTRPMSLPAVTKQMIRSCRDGFHACKDWNQNQGCKEVFPKASTGGVGSFMYSNLNVAREGRRVGLEIM